MGIASNMATGGGAKPVGFKQVGDTVEGRVVGLREKQCEQYPPGSGVLETWPNGDPKLTPVYTVQTELEQEEDDDGRRDIYARGGIFTAIKEALLKAFGPDVADSMVIGSTLKVQFTGTAPSKYGQDRKLYKARFTPAETEAETEFIEGQAAQVDDDIPF